MLQALACSKRLWPSYWNPDPDPSPWRIHGGTWLLREEGLVSTATPGAGDAAACRGEAREPAMPQLGCCCCRRRGYTRRETTAVSWRSIRRRVASIHWNTTCTCGGGGEVGGGGDDGFKACDEGQSHQDQDLHHKL